MSVMDGQAKGIANFQTMHCLAMMDVETFDPYTMSQMALLRERMQAIFHWKRTFHVLLCTCEKLASPICSTLYIKSTEQCKGTGKREKDEWKKSRESRQISTVRLGHANCIKNHFTGLSKHLLYGAES